ncbi:MAG: hypothetical protein Q7K54_02000 [Candidatus Parcubacteria bacterium]|nr:hypothetical protein [Candidatus Parcubacteria bacterium]
MEKKWDKKNEYVGGYVPSGNLGTGYAGKAKGNFGSGAFAPKRPVKTFRDLDVYQNPLECAVLISKNIIPSLEKLKYAYTERLSDCSLAVPLFIAESHSLRFADFALGVGYLEKAMSTANKMVVYLEHIKGIYGVKLDQNLIEDIIGRYVSCRIKMFHLEKSWKRFRTEYGDDKEKKGVGGFKY